MTCYKKNTMVTKGCAVLLLWAVVAGGLFAQSEDAVAESEVFKAEPKQKAAPTNTVTVDIGPTIIGVAMGSLMGSMGGGDVTSSGFGIGVQYERDLLKKLSVAGRFAYMGVEMTAKSTDHDTGSANSYTMGVSSISVEGHARFYPKPKTFFLDGMLGYASFVMSASGKDGDGKSMDAETTDHYFKLGAKIGWRIDFGAPGGFIFEPSFGYAAALGGGGGEIADGVKEIKDLLATYIFAGGPRVSLAFGWRF